MHAEIDDRKTQEAENFLHPFATGYDDSLVAEPAEVVCIDPPSGLYEDGVPDLPEERNTPQPGIVSSPLELTLELTPSSRTEIVDFSRLLANQAGGRLHIYARLACCSYHTTAGFFEQRLYDRLAWSSAFVDSYIRGVQRVFPPNAGYRHDQLHLRTELSDEQRRTEPLNADAHLAFIGSGLAHCISYVNVPTRPVYFIELDGVYGTQRRRRKVKVVGYNREQIAGWFHVPVPVSSSPIDVVNLWDARLGIARQVQAQLDRHGITKGRIDLALAPGERLAGLTVNEYEPLLMGHDVVAVLGNPLHYADEEDDQVMNNASRSNIFRIRRSVSLLVSDEKQRGRGQVVYGTYQSPILLHAKEPATQTRRIVVTLVRFA